MAQEELNVSLFSAESVASMLQHPPDDLVQEVAAELKAAMADPEVMEAFRAVFSPEELEQLHGIDPEELDTALRTALANDTKFQEQVRNEVMGGLTEWSGTISIPQTAAELDSFLAMWQLTGSEQSGTSAQQHGTPQPPAGATPA